MASILGIGNALVDIMTSLESDELLEQFGLPRGSMQLVDSGFSKRVAEGTAHLKRQLSSGGSAANTIHGISRLGLSTAFIGKVGRDEHGEFFRDDMIAAGIRPLLIESDTESGRAIALVSPDSERTFATFLGAAAEMSPEELRPELFKGHDIFHIEGYLVFNHALIRRALELAKSQGHLISLDMASYNVVEANHDFLNEIVAQYVDILFANEDEARAFTGKEAEEAVDVIASQCKIAVVKTGSKGSLIRRGDEKHVIGVIPARPVDTTGAGDLYASGFLYGMVKGLPLDACGRTGALLAGKVIEVMGAKISDEGWMEIRRQLGA